MTTKSFIFNHQKILTDVDKRTSYIGAMREDKQGKILSDRLRLSSGERFLSDDWLREAFAETFDWVKAFTREVESAVREYPVGVLHQLHENEGCYIEVDGVNKGREYVQSIAEGSYKVQETSQQGETQWDVQIPRPTIRVYNGEAVGCWMTIKVAYITGLKDTPISDSGVEVYDFNCYVGKGSYYDLSQNTAFANGVIPFQIRLEDVLGEQCELKQIVSVSYSIDVFSPSRSYNEGDYVEYKRADGGVDYWLVTADYSGDDIKNVQYELLQGNYVGSTVLTMQVLDWQDGNRVNASYRLLYDALVEYVIWRWFEMVNVEEAGVHHDHWEDKCHQAQMSLNSESRILQRGSKWF